MRHLFVFFFSLGVLALITAVVFIVVAVMFNMMGWKI